MTAKEFLSQAKQLDHLIRFKHDQAQKYYDAATQANTALSDMPSAKAPDIHRMGDAVADMVDVKNEIKADLSRLLEIKADIIRTINKVDNITYQTLLSLRYLNFKRWHEIMNILGYESRYIYKLHNKALEKVDIIRDHQALASKK